MDPATLAGLGSLAALKAAVLPGPLAQSTDFDLVLLSIGRGVAGSFDAYLNRKLARQAGAQYVQAADLFHASVDRYPLESVDKVELLILNDTQTGWLDYTAPTFRALNMDAGVVEFDYQLGRYEDRVRLTYTGGYWLDVSADLSGVGVDGQPCPPAATPLPWDLFNAWTLQVAAEAIARNIAGVGIVRDEQTNPSPSLSRYNFTPAVLAVLDNGFRRM